MSSLYCPHSVPRYQSSSTASRVAYVPCHQKSCPVCRPIWDKARIDHLRSVAYTSDELWAAELSLAAWKSVRRLLGCERASYAKAVIGDGFVRILSSKPFPGATRVPKRKLRGIVERLVRASLPRTCLVLKRAWAYVEPERAPSEWENGPKLPGLTVEMILEILREQGIDPAVYSRKYGLTLEWERTADAHQILHSLQAASLSVRRYRNSYSSWPPTSPVGPLGACELVHPSG